MKLRAAAKNKMGTLSPTIAGLLFFGEAYHITEVFPNYFLDYREECDDKAVRWLFRTHSNEGDWSGNIYDFFCKVRTRIDDEVAVPFANCCQKWKGTKHFQSRNYQGNKRGVLCGWQ